MNHTIKRREFLKACASTGAMMILPTRVLSKFLPTPQQNYLPPIRYWMHGFDENYGEESLLRDAMSILHLRFRSMEVLRNTYQLSFAAYFDDSYWKACDMHKQSYYLHHELLWYQITSLASANEFPEVHLHSYYEENNTRGHVKLQDVGIMKVRWGGPNWVYLDGKFKVYLNRRWLATSGDDSDPVRWASWIAHEMLHNLGHDHHDGQYGDQVQINAFTTAVYYGSYFSTNIYLSHFGRCR